MFDFCRRCFSTTQKHGAVAAAPPRSTCIMHGCVIIRFDGLTALFFFFVKRAYFTSKRHGTLCSDELDGFRFGWGGRRVYTCQIFGKNKEVLCVRFILIFEAFCRGFSHK
jgi:hypothetical protein